jgi:hypothetical protein
MCPKIRYDGESEKFYNFFWELNRATVEIVAFFSAPSVKKNIILALKLRFFYGGSIRMAYILFNLGCVEIRNIWRGNFCSTSLLFGKIYSTLN